MPRIPVTLATRLRQIFRGYRPGERGRCIGCGSTVVFGTDNVIDVGGDLCCDEDCHIAFEADRGM